MTIKEFIREQYPSALDRIEILKKDPIREFVNSDIFPCDVVRIDESGNYYKAVFYDGGQREIPVQDLISFNSTEIMKTGDVPLIELYNNYMSMFTVAERANISISLDRIRKESQASLT